MAIGMLYIELDAKQAIRITIEKEHKPKVLWLPLHDVHGRPGKSN